MISLSPRAKSFSHDFETFCKADIRKVGGDAYARDESCEVLMLSYAFDNEPVKQWVPVEGELMPNEVEDAMLDERIVKRCWNKSFEWAIWKYVLGMETPHEAWRDTMVLAYSLALPGKLEKAGEVVGIHEDKKKLADGKSLIRTFSVPRKPTKTLKHTRVHWYMEPEKWERYKLYNRNDTEAERAILRKIRKFDMPEHEWELWIVDQIINERGIPFNMDAVNSAVRLYEHLIADRMDRLRELTGLANPNSNAQLLPWLKSKGYLFDDLKKGNVQRGLARAIEAAEAEPDDFDIVRGVDSAEEARTQAEVLTLRLEVSRASPKKYYAIQRCADHIAGVLRNTFQFAGAGRTWRWAGRTFQPQNLPRPERMYKKIIEMVVEHLEKLDPEAIELIYNNPMDLLVSCIRSVAQAMPGHMFYDADLNAIENRALGWCALDKKILRVFELGRDPYIDFATYMFHQPYDELYAEYKNGDDSKRTISKPAVLGCGYRLGPGEQRLNPKTMEMEANGLLGYAKGMFVKMTPEQAQLSVKVFRETYVDVVQMWYDIEKAALKCVRTGQPTVWNMVRFEIRAPFLLMILPSGRALHYCRPRIESVETPWGAEKMSLTYEGLNDRNQWVRISTHGGKLTENLVQAVARDIIGRSLVRAHDRGLDIRIHVHDQIVGVAPTDQAEEHLSILQACMAEMEDWHIFKGIQMPLASAGFVSKVFMKD